MMSLLILVQALLTICGTFSGLHAFQTEKLLGTLQHHTQLFPPHLCTRDGNADQDKVIQLIVSQAFEKAGSCLLNSLTGELQGSSSSPSVNSLALLAHVLRELGHDDDSDDLSRLIKEIPLVSAQKVAFGRWMFLGPFQIGKAETDGDPVERFGSVHTAGRDRFNSSVKYFSELAVAGEVAWSAMRASGGWLNVDLSENWNELVSSLQSMGVTEWQGWAVGSFVVGRPGAFVVQCLGVSYFYVDDALHVGDVYRCAHLWFPARLDAGLHTVYAKLRANPHLAFRCGVETRDRGFVRALDPPFAPDLYDGVLVSEYIVVPVRNLHPTEWIDGVAITVEGTSGFVTNAVSSFRGDLRVAPGQHRLVSARVARTSAAPRGARCADVTLTLAVATNLGGATCRATLRCRARSQSFVFTFADHDGSTQHAAAVAPLADCGIAACPTLLTLHGTSVSARDQADAHKRGVGGRYEFGVERGWVLAPTRHGAHNWEGPGMLTAVTALSALADLTARHAWIEQKASAHRVVFAGHSMGGHGAWQVATHYTDRALAVVSLAGWIRKEDYGDSNLFMRHDVAAADVDPFLKAILESCVTTCDAERHAGNIRHKPVMIRVGGNDRTVHPYYSRRMYRVLKEQGTNVTYVELPGKEHWWWDTWAENDGGVVNDAQLRQFMSSVMMTDPQQSCTDAACSEPSSNRYTEAANMGRRYEFTYTVTNPADFESMEGVKIIQQETPMRTSKLRVAVHGKMVNITTINVAKFHIERGTRPMWDGIEKLYLDGIRLDVVDADDEDICYQHGQDHTWESCIYEIPPGGTTSEPSSENAAESDTDAANTPTSGKLTTVNREWQQYGPARRVAEKRFIIVAGTGGTSGPLLLRYAVLLANLFYMTSDGVAVVVRDVDLSSVDADDANLVVVGGPHENAHAARLLAALPQLVVAPGSIRLAACSFDAARTGVLTLAPGGRHGLALVLAGNSPAGLEDVVKLAMPTIPPMARSPFSNQVPDFVVTGPETAARGPGGFLCAGFWGNAWEYRTDTAYCNC
ncbi:PREDICTED: uncharacterized protein LOC106815023 [Priapulus caudatus]|uniref:Uncharacterized protein LOC106815023 n=1 Tax=Priapulus caudatus TaxID=37621 RepID=A0ABM1ERW2_PRICU|nr:PREDICTED: uncharacterized protein LOC106815023 [Priapulus caudatus]